MNWFPPFHSPHSFRWNQPRRPPLRSCPRCRKHHPSRRSCFHLLRRGLLKRLVEQVGNLVEQVACILDALVLLAEAEDGHTLANRLGKVGPLRDLEHWERVRRLDLLDSVTVLGVL